MPRPSLKAERTEEVLDAYGRCIAKHGVEGATLERIADEAGLARALIRHNVGNKDELLDAFLDRFLSASAEDSAALFDSLPSENRLSVMIDWLFDPQYSDPHSVNVTSALMIAANDRPKLAKRLRRWTLAFVDSIREELESAHPTQDKETLDTVATGIAAIYFNLESSAPLGRMRSLNKSSKKAAKMLIGALQSKARK